MYIKSSAARPGLQPYLTTEEGKGLTVGMDVALLILEEGQTFAECQPEKEAAFLLFCGAASFGTDEQTWQVSRKSEFAEEASCLHVCAGTSVVIHALAHTEIYVQRVINPARFASKCYLPQDGAARHDAQQYQDHLRSGECAVFQHGAG